MIQMFNQQEYSGKLIINGTTSGFSGILTQDLGGSTVYQQYATSVDGLVNFYIKWIWIWMIW